MNQTQATTDADLLATRARAAVLGRRFTLDDLDGELRSGALAYAATYQGGFGFLVQMQRCAARGLSDGQIVGVLNCLRSEVVRRRPVTSGPDLSGVPDGCYAVANSTSGLSFFRVSRPGTGRFAGTVIVDQITGDELRRRGHQAPGGRYRGTLQSLLEALVADPLGAAIAYGRERRCCGLCGRSLTAENSRQAGVGPVCGERLGTVRAAGPPGHKPGQLAAR